MWCIAAVVYSWSAKTLGRVSTFFFYSHTHVHINTVRRDTEGRGLPDDAVIGECNAAMGIGVKLQRTSGLGWRHRR